MSRRSFRNVMRPPGAVLEESSSFLPPSLVQSLSDYQSFHDVEDLAERNIITKISGFPYDLSDEPVASGTYGKVYKTRDPVTGSAIAVKELKIADFAQMDEKRRKEFITDLYNEVSSVRQLSKSCSQFVINYVDAIWDTNNNRVYIVTDWHQGMTLFRWIREHPNASSEEIAEVTRNLVNGLRCIHKSGIAHRDIKPNNIMIDPETLEVNFIDFGISCLTPFCDMVSGTMPYRMAPELEYHYDHGVRESKAIEYGMDKWALGLTIYALLKGGEPENMFLFVVYPGLDSSSKLREKSPYAFDVMMSLLRSDPDSRKLG